MEKIAARKLKYEDFPLKLFFRLLKKGDSVASRYLGASKWERLKTKWEETHGTQESESELDTQKNVAISFLEAQKAAMLLKWMATTTTNPRPLIEECGFKWYDDPTKLVESLTKIVKKNTAKYKLESAKIEKKEEAPAFAIEEAIYSLNMMGFTITDHDRLTIGQYDAMAKVAERKLKKRD